MTKLEELLEETKYSAKEYDTYKKIEKNNNLNDLNSILQRNLRLGKITNEEYNKAIDSCDEILDTYIDNVYSDWMQDMENAINWVIRGE